jgi:site-specific DNA-methyltransferase (adenine-specific)
MKLPTLETQLDDLLEDYALQHLDWPDSQDELDHFLLSCVDTTDEGESTNRVDRVLTQIAESTAVASVVQGTERRKQQVFFQTESGDGGEESNKINKSQSLKALFNIVRTAYLDVFDGSSTDLLIADPDRNCLFIEACWSRGAQASQAELNHLLLNARKRKLIGKVEGVERYAVPADVMDCYLFASEVALRIVQDKEYFERHRSISLDRILCDPKLGTQFVRLAQKITPGFRPVDYRWAAFRIRKACNRRIYAKGIRRPTFHRLGTPEHIRPSRIDPAAGFFWMKYQDTNLFIGHTENLRRQIDLILGLNFYGFLPRIGVFESLNSKLVEFAIAPFRGVCPSSREPFKTGLVRSEGPRMNVVFEGVGAA